MSQTSETEEPHHRIYKTYQGEKTRSDDQMVHRPSDSRLLANLISHEKEYSKQLQALLDSSHASLASLSAFAAATAHPISQIILSISGDFSSADDALRRYKDAVDAWREQLKVLKDLETEVSTIMRDREILVTRLLKASKNEKPPKDKGNGVPRRNSTSQGLHVPSSSSLSLSLDHSAFAPNGPPPSSNKLAAARNELQACEAHLAEKERELEGARVTAIRDGLRIRCNALIDCGRSWVEMGKEGLRSTENLRVEEGDIDEMKYPQGAHPVPALPHHIQTETGSDHHYRLSSDFSSISPSQSASQVNNITDQYPSIIPNAPNPILGVNGSDIQPESSFPVTHTPTTAVPAARPSSTPPLIPPPIDIPSPYILPRSSSLTQVAPMRQPRYVYEHNRIEVLPAHAIQDDTMPTVTATTHKPEATRTSSGYITPVSTDNEPKSTMEHSTGYRITGADEGIYGERSGESRGLSKEERLVREGKLQVVENPRFQHKSVSEPLASKTTPADERVTAMPQTALLREGPPQEQLNVAGVREIQQEAELPKPLTEPPPGVPSSVPTGEPHTPKKRLGRPGSPSPHKSRFLGSLKKVFSRESSMTREEKEREREEKERERKERARERELKREEKMREQEEKREERMRGKDKRTQVKKKQKDEREREHQRRLLVPDSSDEDEVGVDDTDSLRRYRMAGRKGGFIGLGKKDDEWTTRADRNLAEIRRESADMNVGEVKTYGYVVRRNTDLEKNLKGGIMSGVHAAPVDLRKGRKIQSDTEGQPSGERWRTGTKVSSGSTFVVERGAKVTRSSSVPPSAPGAAPSTSRTIPSASGIETRFREDLNSPKVNPARATHGAVVVNSDMKNKGYSSDTSDLAASARISGIPTAPTFVSPTTGAITVPSVHRKPSKRISKTDGEGDGTGRHATFLSAATTPAGTSTGLSGRRGSVGVSVASPRPAAAGFHRRALSVDYGRNGPVVTAPVSRGSITSVPAPQTTGAAWRSHESLMSIVDNVTRSNRQAWDAGLMESKMDRTIGMKKNEVRRIFLGPASGQRSATAGETRAAASPRVDRQSLLSSLKGTPGSPGRAQLMKADPTPEQKPLKSALRPPLPEVGPVTSRGHFPGFATQTGKNKIIPMEVLPSVTSLAAADTNGPPPPVERIRSIGNNVAEYVRDGCDDDDDSASTSSYETGREEFDDDEGKQERTLASGGIHAMSTAPKPGSRQEEDIDRRQGLGSSLVMPLPVRSSMPPSHSVVPKNTPPPDVFTPSSTPQRRKSVRVSLKPTFSPTPPAIEDEEDEAGRAPFVFRAPRPRDTMDLEVHTPSPVRQAPKNYGAQKSTGKDVWDDDSDEDSEYQRAKSLLLRATRREKEVMGKSNGRF